MTPQNYYNTHMLLALINHDNKSIDRILVPTLLGTVATNGATIVIVRPGIRDPSVTTIDDMVRCIYSMLDVLFQEDEMISVTGVNMVADMQGLSFSHVAQMTPAVIKKMTTVMQVKTRS